MRLPELHYFACRSRGEPIRLLCALAEVSFTELSVPEEQDNGRRQLPPPQDDPAPNYLTGDLGRLANTAAFPFGTCLKWVEWENGSIDESPLVINQSNAILRHIARKTGFVGSTSAEAAQVDAWLDHCEDIRKAYIDVVYGLDEPPFDETLTNSTPRVAAAFAAHEPKVVDFFKPFEAQLNSNASAGAMLVGVSITVADIGLCDLFDCHLRLWPVALCELSFLKLHAHRAVMQAQPGIMRYLQSGRQWSRVNGNSLG